MISVIGLISFVFYAYAEDYHGYKPVEVGLENSKGDTVMQLLDKHIRHFPLMEGRPHLNLELSQRQGQLIFHLFETGFADDSLAGFEHKGIIEGQDGNWQLIELYRRPICQRGWLSFEGKCP